MKMSIIAGLAVMAVAGCASDSGEDSEWIEQKQEWQEVIDECGAEAPWVEIREDDYTISIGSKSGHPDQFDVDVALCLSERLGWDTDLYDDMKAREARE